MMSDLEDLITEFGSVLDPMERFELLMDQSIHLIELPDQERTEDVKVRGCQSIAYVVSENTNEGYRIRGYADSMIVSGMMGLLSIVVSGMDPSDVADLGHEWMLQLGVTRSLTPSRSNGFRNMFEQVKSQASGLVQ